MESESDSKGAGATMKCKVCTLCKQILVLELGGYDELIVLLWSGVKATYMPGKHANLPHEG